jgi:pyruvate/2-oxoglutarate dehydrogenase complex dihydrolipoamide dehydrogenase (E3) component
VSRILTPDICIIGAGSGGLSVAAAAAAFGVDVVLIERARMGGDCLNVGCVPSKALIAAAKRATMIREAPGFGIHAGDPSVDFPAVAAHIRSVIAAIAPNDSVQRFTRLGVTVIAGHARFTDPRTVEVADATIRARRFVIATGSRPAIPEIAGLDQVPFLTNETIFDIDTLPSRLAVVGGGAIGLELSQAYRRLGSEVTVLEAGKILAREDPDLAAPIRARLVADGLNIVEDARILRVEPRPQGAALILADCDRVEATHLLVAAGRSPNVEDLGLAIAGISTDRDGIVVDAGLRTANRGVYAIGDVASVYHRGARRGPARFTHWANYHAGLVLRSILFRLPVSENRDLLPRVTFTDPEIAQVGLTEAEARLRFGDRVRALIWPRSANDRAEAERETEGLVKVIVGPGGRILGAGMVGRNAGEELNLWSLALTRGLKIGAMATFISPYPTQTEIGKRAAVTSFASNLTSPLVRRILAALRLLG